MASEENAGRVIQSAEANSLSESSTGGPLPLPPSSTPPPSYHNLPGIGLHLQRPSLPPYEHYDPNVPPPSYESLFGRVREVRKSSSGILDFLKNLIILFLGAIGFGLIFGITIVIPILMILMGSIYLYECPQGEYIPVYLLVGGVFGVIKQLLHLSASVRRGQEERDEERVRQSPTQTLITCFMVGWFIIGSMWVYRIYEPNYDKSSGAKYCNRTLYTFAFWLITSVYISLGIITVCLCSIGVASVLFQKDM